MKFCLFLLLMMVFYQTYPQRIIVSNQGRFIEKEILLLPPLVEYELLKTRKESDVSQAKEDLNKIVAENILQITNSFFMMKRINLKRINDYEIDELPVDEIWKNYLKFTTNKRGQSTNYSHKKLKEIFEEIVISDSLASFISAKNVRYAVAMVSVGFSRTEANNKDRRINNTAKTLFFGAGAYNKSFGGFSVQSKNFVANYIFLIDSKSKKLLMFNRKEEEIEPTNKERFQGILMECLNEYW